MSGVQKYSIRHPTADRCVAVKEAQLRRIRQQLTILQSRMVSERGLMCERLQQQSQLCARQALELQTLRKQNEQLLLQSSAPANPPCNIVCDSCGVRVPTVRTDQPSSRLPEGGRSVSVSGVTSYGVPASDMNHTDADTCPAPVESKLTRNGSLKLSVIPEGFDENIESIGNIRALESGTNNAPRSRSNISSIMQDSSSYNCDTLTQPASVHIKPDEFDNSKPTTCLSTNVTPGTTTTSFNSCEVEQSLRTIRSDLMSRISGMGSRNCVDTQREDCIPHPVDVDRLRPLPSSVHFSQFLKRSGMFHRPVISPAKQSYVTDAFIDDNRSPVYTLNNKMGFCAKQSGANKFLLTTSSADVARNGRVDGYRYFTEHL